MSNLSKGTKEVLIKTSSVLTAAAAVLSLSGVLAFAPVASAATPAEFGLREGDMISADGVATDVGFDPDIYIVNDWGYKRLFLNPVIFSFYGHLGGYANVKHVSGTTRDAFGTSGLFRNCESGEQAVWAVQVTGEDTGVFHHVVMSGDEAVAQDSNFFKKVFCINNNEANWYPKGSDYTSLSQVPVYSRTGTSPTPSPVAGFNPNGNTQGSIDDYTLGSPAKSEALEGQSNVEIYAVDVKTAPDGPLMLQSADVWFANSDSTSDLKPWTYFTNVKLMLGGNVIASKNISSAADFSDYVDSQISVGSTTREYRLRFTGLSAVLPSDATSKLSVSVSVVNTIDTADQSAVWNVELGEHRVLDESGLTVNTSDSNTTELEDSFTVDVADEAALSVMDANDAVDARVIQVDETTDTNNVAVYRFSIEETNGVAVDIDELALNFLAVSSQSAALSENDIFSRARIMEGSTQRGADETVTSVGSASFTNLGIHLAADQKKDFVVQVDLRDTNDGARYREGALISLNVDDDGTLVFTDANGNDEADITPTVNATSNTHELRTMGIQLGFRSAAIAVTPGNNSNSDIATATIKFSVTAFGTDAYVDNTAPASTSASTFSGSATQYNIPAGEANATGTATLTADDTISGEGTNGFKVQDGSTRNFTMTVAITATNATSSFVDAALLNLHYALTDANGTLGYTFDLGDYKTSQVFISNP